VSAPNNDPLGKRILFSRSASQVSADRDLTDEGIEDDEPASGHSALFSGDDGAPAGGPITVECSHCGETSTVSIANLARRALPLPLWNPLRRHSRLVQCPKCNERTWARVSWGG
jgi:hypothetical protein